MSYIGNQPATSFETVQKQISTSNSGTTITLDRAVTSVQDILLTIDAVVQSYDNYSVSGTTLTVGGTLSNNRVEILYVGRTMQSVDPTDDSVSTSKIKTDAVTTAKVQNDAITVDKLNLISTSSVPSLEAKGTSGVTEGYIQLNCAENSHGIKLKSPPHSAGASYTLTFPNNDGNANQFLQTNGSGVLSFADAPGGGFVRVGGHNHGTSDSDVNTVTLDNIMTSTYKVYKIIGKFETTTDAYLTIGARTGGASGSTYSGSNKYKQTYFAHWTQSNSTNSTTDSGDWGSGLIYPHGTNILSDGDDDHAVFLDMTFWKDAVRSYYISHTVTLNGDKSRVYAFQNSGWLQDSNTYTGFIFQFSSGDLDQCTVDVYGMVNS